MWSEALKKVNTNDNLQRRRLYMMISPNICVTCMEEAKHVNHLFVHYKFAHAIWNNFFSLLYLSWVVPKDVMDLIHQWNCSFLGIKGRIT